VTRHLTLDLRWEVSKNERCGSCFIRKLYADDKSARRFALTGCGLFVCIASRTRLSLIARRAPQGCLTASERRHGSKIRFFKSL
jgi:hypothetical protein